MRSFRRHCMVVSFALLAGTAACKKEGGAAGSGGAAGDDLNVVPADSDVVLNVDLAKLRASGLYKDFGEKVLANVTYTKTFFEQEKTFVLGVVPVVVTAGATGEVGLALEASGGELSLTPSVALAATLEAGVGAGSSVAGASAGLRGSLTLLELALPFSLRVFVQDNAPHYEIRGDLTLATLSGSLALYAKAFVKVWFVECSVEWSKKLFGWGGVEWSRNLFDKTGRF